MKQSNAIIGITGGIATGKSTVTKILLDKGFTVIDADKIAKKVVEIGEPCYVDIVDVFGKKILNEYLEIDRKKLGDIIFKDEEARKKLNRIVHPKVFDEIKKHINLNELKNKIIFLDIPLLIESIKEMGQNDIYADEIWLIYVELDTQIDRLMNRDKISKDEALMKINAQMSLEEKKQYADRIIYNDGTIEELKIKISKIIDEVEFKLV
ncbi:dephospho-CoA kinase [Clostridiisalibacter paucivorans]|uniref:dephospho-CoA kinase n=1 Tax=Clostridiisalibacter paucivorans TaxID=408753 RepID=UPI00047AEF1D|nr:dephospho-CoA kinase [Clostridiisalibacter paucivorans]